MFFGDVEDCVGGIVFVCEGFDFEFCVADCVGGVGECRVDIFVWVDHLLQIVGCLLCLFVEVRLWNGLVGTHYGDGGVERFCEVDCFLDCYACCV